MSLVLGQLLSAHLESRHMLRGVQLSDGPETEPVHTLLLQVTYTRAGTIYAIIPYFGIHNSDTY